MEINKIIGEFGSKLSTHGHVVAIAKAVRANIRACKVLPKDNPDYLPAIKVSVRVDKYSMGQSLHVRVVGAPFSVANPAYYVAKELCQDWFTARAAGDLESRETDRVRGVLERIVGQYNYDRSDPQSDYFNVNFYSHITVASELLDEHAAMEVKAHAELIKDMACVAVMGEVETFRNQLASINDSKQEVGDVSDLVEMAAKRAVALG